MLVDYFDEMTTQSIVGPGLNWRLWLPPTDNHKWEHWGYSWRHGAHLMICRACGAESEVYPHLGRRYARPYAAKPCPGAAQGVRR